ncbi:hypothetical protein [uncultured Thomasclavelia sp.]|uniref:hypothetical protein n=1 Tax=uncultured Thomasclavelia sp. TaxID=3025759 RepID=UPI0025F08FFB|nr:hypothetical protein [uncultured Thomasclavelia sp.]
MKLEWNEPKIIAEEFKSNEFVAACGDSGTTYLFNCDAGGGTPGSVYQETNGKDGLQTTGGRGYRADTELTAWPFNYYYACDEKHTAESTDDFLNGYYCPNGYTRNAQQVIIWRGIHGDDIHCTTNLDQDSWETAKS